MSPDEFRAALERLEMKPAHAATALGIAVPSIYRYLKGARKIPKPMELAIGNIEKLRAYGEKPADKYRPMVTFETPGTPFARLRVDREQAAAHAVPATDAAGVLRLLSRLQDERDEYFSRNEQCAARLDACFTALEQVENAIAVGDTEVVAGVVALALQQRGG